MPIYEYRCESNGRTIEVSHSMSESVGTWGRLCELAGIEPGSTPTAAHVEKLISMPVAHGSDRASGSTATGGHAVPPGGCGQGCGCIGL